MDKPKDPNIVTVSAGERRKLLGLIWWNPEADALEIDLPHDISREEGLAMLRRYIPSLPVAERESSGGR